MKYSRIFIDGPQGAGKTTCAEVLSSDLGYTKIRGIPTGEELARLDRWQVWLKSVRLGKSNEDFVSDRSVLSLWAYDRSQYPEDSTRVDKFALKIIDKICIQNRQCLFILLDLPPHICLERQLPGVCQLSSIEAMQQEIDQYRHIYEVMRENSLHILRVSHLDTPKNLLTRLHEESASK